VAFGFLCFLLFSLERRNELPSCLKQRLSIGQDNSTAPTSLIAHGQIWGNDELTEEFRFKKVLKALIEKTLQLTFAPNLAMSRLPVVC